MAAMIDYHDGARVEKTGIEKKVHNLMRIEADRKEYQLSIHSRTGIKLFHSTPVFSISFEYSKIMTSLLCGK